MKPRKSIRKKSKRPEQVKFKKALEIQKAKVRARGKCEMKGAGAMTCGGYLQASHIKPEGAYRHMGLDLDNMICACYRHHIFWWHKDITGADAWVRVFLGETKYKELQDRANIKPPPQVDQLFIKEKLKG